MAASHSGNAWAELHAVCNALPYGTVADLKHVILSVNNECGTHMIRSGKKQDLVDRLCAQFGAWKSNNNTAKWTTAKAIIDQIKLPVSSFMPAMPMSSLPLPPRGVTVPYSSVPNPAQVSLPMSRSVSTSALPHSTNFSPGYRFKQSPFFTIDQVVSDVLECPESYNPTDRRECTLRFRLNDEQLTKLRAPGSPYQLRLFCTSSKFYSPGYNGNTECLIEFPPTCEITINETQLKSALLKGIKKRPGTAPPPDLGAVDAVGASNSVRMIYINSGQGTLELKKYYLVVQLVKAHSVSTLVDQLRTTRFVSGRGHPQAE
ncbi:PINIT domain-containing protein [Mycena vulgaris]|nr:PINIT domain-containing protein [Mycena vulgaris]